MGKKEEPKPFATSAETEFFMRFFESAERQGLPDAKYLMKRSVDEDGFVKVDITMTRFTFDGVVNHS